MHIYPSTTFRLFILMFSWLCFTASPAESGHKAESLWIFSLQFNFDQSFGSLFWLSTIDPTRWQEVVEKVPILACQQDNNFCKVRSLLHPAAKSRFSFLPLKVNLGHEISPQTHLWLTKNSSGARHALRNTLREGNTTSCRAVCGILQHAGSQLISRRSSPWHKIKLIQKNTTKFKFFFSEVAWLC